MKLLITNHFLSRHIERYKSFILGHDIQVKLPMLNGQYFSESELIKHVKDVDICICGDDDFTEKVLQASNLKAIIKWGIGVDSIDLEAAQNLSIKVFNTPGVFADEVADLALAMYLNIARQLFAIHTKMRQGEWAKITSSSLSTQKVGVVGNGSIGKAIVKRLLAFNCDVQVYSRSKDSPYHTQMDKLISTSDCIILACPLTDETFHLIDDRAISHMKKGVTIINIARGSVIDEEALIRGLQSKTIAGAGLDVFEIEPIQRDNPLLEFNNVILNSHNGSNTFDAINKVNELSLSMATKVYNEPDQSLYHPIA